MKDRNQSVAANCNQSVFADFMQRYWHQMADVIYPNLSVALAEFKAENGTANYSRLSAEIRQMVKKRRFPSKANIRAAHADPFWAQFDRVIPIEELPEHLVGSEALKNSND